MYLLAAVAMAAPLKANAYVANLEEGAYVANHDNGDGHATPLVDSFDITGAKFTNYAPAAGDPVIGYNGGPNDLLVYRLNVHGVVNTVTPDPVWGPLVNYTGSYTLFYDQNGTNAYDSGDFRVSSGSINVNALYDAEGGANLDGTLDQVLGPETLPFADLGPTVKLSGRYQVGEVASYGNLFNGVLSRGANQVPEPGTMGLLAAGLLPLLGLRRRRA
jgi:hypothetical protein